MGKGRSIIIGFDHIGKVNAECLIDALEKEGLKEGDLVAFEGNKEELTKTGFQKFVMNTAKLDLLIDKFKILNGKTTPKKFIVSKNYLEKLREEMSFGLIFRLFLVSRKLRLLPLDTSAIYRKDARLSGNQEKVKLADMIKIGTRENRWRKILKKLPESPRFILVGYRHVSAVKKMVPYTKAIDLSKRPFGKKVRNRIASDILRIKYKTIKTKKKVLRKLGIKPRI